MASDDLLCENASCSLSGRAAPAHADEPMMLPPAPAGILRDPASILTALHSEEQELFSTLRSRFCALSELIISEFLIYFLKSI